MRLEPYGQTRGNENPNVTNHTNLHCAADLMACVHIRTIRLMCFFFFGDRLNFEIAFLGVSDFCLRLLIVFFRGRFARFDCFGAVAQSHGDALWG